MSKNIKTITPKLSKKKPKSGSMEDSINVSINGPLMSRMTLDKILSNENIDRVHKGHQLLASQKGEALKDLLKKESGNDRLGDILEGIIDGYYKKKEEKA